MSVGAVGGSQPSYPQRDPQSWRQQVEKDIEEARADLKKQPPDEDAALKKLQDAVSLYVKNNPGWEGDSMNLQYQNFEYSSISQGGPSPSQTSDFLDALEKALK